MCIHHNPEDLFIVSGPGDLSQGQPIPSLLPAAWQTGSVGYGLGTGLGKARSGRLVYLSCFNYLSAHRIFPWLEMTSSLSLGI